MRIRATKKKKTLSIESCKGSLVGDKYSGLIHSRARPERDGQIHQAFLYCRRIAQVRFVNGFHLTRGHLVLWRIWCFLEGQMKELLTRVACHLTWITQGVLLASQRKKNVSHLYLHGRASSNGKCTAQQAMHLPFFKQQRTKNSLQIRAYERVPLILISLINVILC